MIILSVELVLIFMDRILFVLFSLHRMYVVLLCIDRALCLFYFAWLNLVVLCIDTVLYVLFSFAWMTLVLHSIGTVLYMLFSFAWMTLVLQCIGTVLYLLFSFAWMTLVLHCIGTVLYVLFSFAWLTLVLHCIGTVLYVLFSFAWMTLVLHCIGSLLYVFVQHCLVEPCFTFYCLCCFFCLAVNFAHEGGWLSCFSDINGSHFCWMLSDFIWVRQAVVDITQTKMSISVTAPSKESPTKETSVALNHRSISRDRSKRYSVTSSKPICRNESMEAVSICTSLIVGIR